MPEIQVEGLEVSAEEERYLRGAFRRFALPYLAATIAMAGVAVAAVSLTSGDPASGASEELQSLVAEAASLREAIAGLRDELREHASNASGRITRLESGLAKVESEESDGSAEAEWVSRLDHAHERIRALESRLSEIETTQAAAPPPPPPSWPAASPALP